MYNRPQISRIFCEGMERLKRETNLPIKVFAAISDNESRAVCIEYGAEYFWHENKPLGAKWNAVFNFAAKHQPDFIFFSGDDDLYSSEYLNQFILHGQSGALGLDNLVFMNSETAECLHFKYKKRKTIGAGRIIPRSVYSKLLRCKSTKRSDNNPIDCNSLQSEILKRDNLLYNYSECYEPFSPQINSGLDTSFEISLGETWNEINILPLDGMHCIDIKSEQNIWGFHHFRGKSIPVSFEDATWFLSQIEIRMLNSLISIEV